MTQEYTNRKKMLNDYYIDFVAPDVHGKTELKQLINSKLNDMDIYNVDDYRIDCLALSFGLYGMNGGVFAVSESGNLMDTQLVFAVTSRNTLLFELA